MKKTWNTPQLIVYGPVQELTQKDFFEFEDGIFFGRDGSNRDDGSVGGSL